MNVLSLFSGIGGLDLGLERAGMTVVGQVEIDGFCRRVLAKHWPKVAQHDDVRTCLRWWRGIVRPHVHVVAGGFPCQPVSVAGRGLAQDDQRWLWEPMRDVVTGLVPEWVVIENVPGLRRRGLDIVLRDLHGIGYSAAVGVISACALGAPHTRERLFILAHSGGPGRCPWRGERGVVGQPPGVGRVESEPVRRSWWSGEPGVRRVAHGIPQGVDRRRALGNAVVPQVGEYIGRLITGPALEVAA